MSHHAAPLPIAAASVVGVVRAQVPGAPLWSRGWGLIGVFATAVTASGFLTGTAWADDARPVNAPPASAHTLNAHVEQAGEGYDVRAVVTEAARVGQPARMEIFITPKSPFKCNEQYPYRFKAEATDGLEYTAAVTKPSEVAPAGVRFQVEFVPKRPGAIRVRGELSLSVCTAEKCLVHKQVLDLPLTVAAAP